MVNVELKRDRLIFRLRGSKYEWIIEPRYWRNPIIGFCLLLALSLLVHQISPYNLGTITSANLLAAAAIPLGWMTIGTGRLNFGPQFFVGLGGYTAALLSIHYGFGASRTLLIVFLICLAFGFLMSPLAVVAKGLYYVLLTFLIPFVFLDISIIYADIFKGEVGLSGIAPLLRIYGKIRLTYLVICLLSTILMLAYLIFTDKILRSRFGLFMAAINDDEEVAQAVGINIKKIKILSFAIPASLIGIVGWFYAHYYTTFAGISYLPPTFLIKILFAFIIGGRAQIYGVIMGAYFITFLEMFLVRTVGALAPFILFTILIICLLTLPEGLWGLYRKRHYREYLPTLRVRR